MKKQVLTGILIGMMILTAVVSVSGNAYAIDATADAHADALRDYQNKIADTLKLDGTTTASSAVIKAIAKRIASQFTGMTESDFAMGSTSPKRLQQFAKLAASIRFAKTNSDTDLLRSVNVLAKTVKNASLVGAKNSTDADTIASGKAFSHVADIAADVALWKSTSRKSITDILDKANQMVDAGSATPEEAMIESVMSVLGGDKPLSRADAMKKIRDFQDCE